MFLESKNAVFASKKCRILTMYSISMTYRTSRELRFFDRRDSLFPKCALFALREVNLSRSFKNLTNRTSPLCLYHADKVLMEPRILIEFGMEGGDELVSLTGSNDMSIHHCQHLHLISCLLDIRCADEGHGHLVGNPYKRCHYVETAQLSSVGIAACHDIHGS